MLVLSRKTRQQIRIGENITVTILLVKGQTVRVGIEAPRNVRVLRAELPVHEDMPPGESACPRADGTAPPVESAFSGSSERGDRPMRRRNRSAEGGPYGANAAARAADLKGAVRAPLMPRDNGAATDASPGLLPVRRRGSLASLAHHAAPSGTSLRPLFARH